MSICWIFICCILYLFVAIFSGVSCIFNAPSFLHLTILSVGKRFPFRWWRRWLRLGWWLQWWWNTAISHWWGRPLCFLCGYNQRYFCPCSPIFSLSLQYILFGRPTCKYNSHLVNFLYLALQASDPLRFQSLTQTLDFHFQALANGVAQHAEQRRVEIEKEKLEKASAVRVAS